MHYIFKKKSHCHSVWMKLNGYYGGYTPCHCGGLTVVSLIFFQMANGFRHFEVEYLGDPDLQPIRTYESTTLVRLLFRVCSVINQKVRLHFLLICLIRDVQFGHSPSLDGCKSFACVKLAKATSYYLHADLKICLSKTQWEERVVSSTAMCWK